MGTLVVAFAKVKDAAKLQEYASAAGPTILAAGGTIVGRGKFKGMLAGNLDVDSGVVLRFENAEAAKAWYASPAYQALIAVRDQALTPTFLMLEEPV